MDKILVVQTAFLGDVILMTPLLRALRQIFPAARIDVLVRPQFVSALQGNPHVAGVLTFEKKKRLVPEFIRLVGVLRRERYTIAVTPHSSPATALLLWLGGVPRRVGFNRYAARHLLTDRLPHGRGMHKTEKIMHLMQAFSTDEFDRTTQMFPGEDDRALAAQLAPDENTIVLAPGSVWATKRWPAAHYAQLADMLTQAGYPVVFSGGRDEKALCDEIIAATGHNLPNYAGRLSIIQSAALFQRCRLLVCNDSGALHIANAVGTPVYAIFGPTVTALGFYPYRPHDRIFQVELHCRGTCGSHGGKACPLGHHNCMNKIPPQQVFAEITQNFPPEPTP